MKIKGTVTPLRTQAWRFRALLAAAALGALLASCGNALLNPGYTMELYSISASTYNYLNTGSHFVNEAVDYAKKQSGTAKMNSGSGDSTEDVRAWLANYFYSSDINTFMGALERSGHHAAIFRVADSSSYGLVYVKEN